MSEKQRERDSNLKFFFFGFGSGFIINQQFINVNTYHLPQPN